MANSVLWIGINALTSLFEVFLMFIFFRDFLQQRMIRKLTGTLLFICGYTALFAGNALFSEKPDISFLILLAVTVTVGMIRSNAIIYKRIFSSLLFVALTVFIGGTSSLMTAILHRINIDNFRLITDNTMIEFEVILIKNLFLLIIIRIICRFRVSAASYLKSGYLFALLIVPLISIFIVHTMLLIVLEAEGKGIVYAAFGLTGVLHMNLLVFLLFESLINRMQKDYRHHFINERTEMQTLHYNDLMEKNREVHEIWHDFKNHINCIFSLSKKGNYTELDKYIQSLVNMESPLKDIDTGNPVIDAVLTGKKSKALKQDIIINSILNIPPRLQIEPLDICIILGNALDNAIEAVNKIPDDCILPKVIDVKMEMLGDCFSLSISNPFSGLPEKEGKFYKTSKNVPGIHGVGLHSIERTVNKHDGIMLIRTENNYFTIEIVLNLNNKRIAV